MNFKAFLFSSICSLFYVFVTSIVQCTYYVRTINTILIVLQTAKLQFRYFYNKSETNQTQSIQRIQGRPDERCAGGDDAAPRRRYRWIHEVQCEGGGGTLRRAVPAQIAETARIASPLPTPLFTAAVEYTV